jgi:hypothetical protein
MWSLWNEPNQGGWLSPQWETRGGKKVPASPALFRKLYQSGYQGLLATGHRVDNDVILMGETAPLGSDAKTEKSPMRPKQFIREVFCIKPDGTPYTGADAKVRDCGDLAKAPLKATGWAHHPYTKNLPPTERDPNPDSLTMANIDELGTLLDEMSAKTGAISANMPLYMTEYGFESNPPDPFSGVPLAAQAKYNTLGEYLAWGNPRILSQAQFLLADVPPVRGKPKTSKSYWFTYQSGLFFLNGTPKPSATAYAMPFLAFNTNTLDAATGGTVFNFWGQMRLLPNDVTAGATIQWRAKDGSTPWMTVGDPAPIDPMGYFEATAVAPLPVEGEWRSALLLPDGTVAAFSPGTPGT